jgi:iron complex transport system ATP-binding protein
MSRVVEAPAGLAVCLRGVSVAYDGVPALRSVDVTVPAGGWLCLVGPNGAGKTTLLRSIGGLVSVARGEVLIGESPVAVLGRREVARLVARVPQRPDAPPAMTVVDYVLLGRTPHIPYLGVEGASDLRIVTGVLERLELTPLAGRRLETLSGGELQRVIVAVALAQESPVLLLDEPTAALDVGHQLQVLELVDELRRERSLTVVSAMHDLTLAGQFADELVLLSEGLVVASGEPRTVLTPDIVARHYGAAVRILEDDDGRVHVLPSRRTNRP